MHVQKENKIGDIVTRNFQTAKVFESLGLDFCCGGKKTIQKACIDKGIDPDFVIQEISKVDEVNQTASHFSNWDVDFLIDYIVNNHHSYILTSIPSIEHHLQKVIAAHGEKYPHLTKVDTIFCSLKDELLTHMAKEEKMLFPYIKKMNFAYKNELEMTVPPFGTISIPMGVMENEHEAAGNMIGEIKKLTDNYIPPLSACATFKLLYNELKDFEADLHIHIHLENNILFPKAIELESKLLCTKIKRGNLT